MRLNTSFSPTDTFIWGFENGFVYDGQTGNDDAFSRVFYNLAKRGYGGVVYIGGPCAVESEITPPINVSLVGYQTYNRTLALAAPMTSFLCPTPNFSGSSLLQLGVSGNGSLVSTNPHGINVFGIGFNGNDINGVQRANSLVNQNDTAEVKYQNSSFVNGVTYGTNIQSTVASNNGSVSPHFTDCDWNNSSTNLNADGLGSTDGYLTNCLVRNPTNANIQLGISNAGGGGWLINNTHLVGSGTQNANHIKTGTSAIPVLLGGNTYLDTIGGTYIVGCGNLQLSNVTILLPGGTSISEIISLPGVNPRLTANNITINTNGNTGVKGLFQLIDASAVENLLSIGNINVADGTNQPPASYVGHLLNSSGVPIFSPTFGGSPSLFNMPVMVSIPITLNPTSTAAASAVLAVGPPGNLVTVQTISEPASVPANIGHMMTFILPARYAYTLTLTNATSGTPVANFLF